MSENSKTNTSSQVDAIPLEALLETIRNQFDHLVEIHVVHFPSGSDVSSLWIKVIAGDAESYEEYLDVSSSTHVSINTGNKAPLRLPYTVIGTFDGPGNIQGPEATTVYMSEDVVGSGARDMQTGLTRLREKLNDTCPTCKEQVDGLGQHYHEKRTCAEADFSI